MIEPDAVARIQLFPTRPVGIPPGRFRCVVFWGSDRRAGNDCAFLFDANGPGLQPGSIAEVPIKFLDLEAVGSKAHPGARFTLWEGGDIGEGVILTVRSAVAG